MVRMVFEKMIAQKPVEAGQIVAVRRRTWSERWLSWPWRPWTKRAAIRSGVELEPNPPLEKNPVEK